MCGFYDLHFEVIELTKYRIGFLTFMIIDDEWISFVNLHLASTCRSIKDKIVSNHVCLRD